VPKESIEEQWEIATLESTLQSEWQLSVPLTQMLKDEPELADEDLLAKVLAAADAHYLVKVELVGREAFGNFERSITLQSIDQHWREHLSALDYLRQGIHLRGYAQKNPKQEYKREAFELFELMLQTIRNEVTRVLMNVQIQSAAEAEQVAETVEDKAEAAYGGASYVHADAAGAGNTAEEPESVALRLQAAPAAEDESELQPFRRFGQKIGRNDPCPCGSGKKYKQCHGRLN
jgi:preprotein translocase subunit SecA